MILNARQNSFVLLFPPEFFSEEINEKYKEYFDSLLLPFETVEDFMSFTVQQIEFPGWSMEPASQTRTRGKKYDVHKSSKPIADLFKREFSITFKLTDSYLNYIIWLDNSLNFLDFSNTDKKVFNPLQLILLNNEGYMVSNIVFNKPILTGQDNITLSQSSVTPEFTTFSVNFRYFDFKVELLTD